MLGYVDLSLSANNVQPKVGQVLDGSSAMKAGIMVGDKIMQVDGKKVEHWPDLQEHIAGSVNPQLRLIIERDGKVLEKELVPQENSQKDIFGREHKVRRIGIAPEQIKSADDVVIVRYGFFGAMKKAGEELVSITVKTYIALYEMAIGLRSVKEAMGPVGMFFVIKFALSVSFAFLLHIVGVISASLAIFNLLPVIPLDGGHLFLLGIEKLRGKALSLKADLWVSRVGLSLILTLALCIFYVDFERVGWLDKVVHIWHNNGSVNAN